MTTVTGTVDNGRRARLVMGSVNVLAGVREHDGGAIEVAFFGRPPRLPATCTVDDVAYQVVDAWKSGTVRDMAVLLATPSDG